MLLYLIEDEQGHRDVVATMQDAKLAVKHVMWDKPTTWITEIQIPQDKKNVLELTRAKYGLPSTIVENKTGREWWVTVRGGVKENQDVGTHSQSE
jgi:hypothetical protein